MSNRSKLEALASRHLALWTREHGDSGRSAGGGGGRAGRRATDEYEEIADGLVDIGVLAEERRPLLRDMAGYRNRLVHFYDRVSEEELNDICVHHAGDIQTILDEILAWVRERTER